MVYILGEVYYVGSNVEQLGPWGVGRLRCSARTRVPVSLADLIFELQSELEE